jgi:ABC-type proline/glycine betaine transport system permease subunit
MTVLKHSANDSGRTRPVPRWVAPVFAVLGAATIPWTVHLAMSLPPQARTHHYRVSWVGFDILLIVALLATAYFSWRGWRHVGVVAASTATLLVVDAWFDVTTSRPADVSAAILSAVLVELPLAVVCGWIAAHVDRVVERRLHQLARRARFRAGLQPGPEAVATVDASAADELQ